MRSQNFHVSIYATIVLLAANLCAAQMVVAPDRFSGVYQVGDTVHWLVEWKGESNAPTAHYALKSGGQTDVGHGNLIFNNNIATLETKFTLPGTMLAEVKWLPGNNTNRAVGGAVAAPNQIVPAAPAPVDFDLFWKSKLKELEKVPANSQLEQADSGKYGVEYWKITMDNIRGTQIHGQIARPETGERFPALLIMQWAGVYGLQKRWVTDRAAEGWLALNIEPHDLPIDESSNYYKGKITGPLKLYWSIGDDDRDTSYFLRMYLSCYRAVEYLKTRSDWNGKTLVVMGTSQGGQQTLMIAGLHPKDITAALALVPAGGDIYIKGKVRYHGSPADYADLYKFVRDQAILLDGYEDAAYLVPGTAADSRYLIRPPVTISGNTNCCAFVRAIPDKVNSPIVIHLVDWSDTHSGFDLTLDKQRFSDSSQLSLFLFRPGTQKVRLSFTETSDLLTAKIPPLTPWGIVTVCSF